MPISRPTANKVEYYLNKWDTLENYVAQEEALNLLFKKTFPKNTRLDEILVKVCTLNDFYSTNIFSPYKVGKHINALNIDKRLKQRDYTLVKDIAKTDMGKGKYWNFYSFATKYCSHHYPDLYPIYDYYVDKLLMALKRKDGFVKFVHSDLLNYPSYVEIIDSFKTFYGLGTFSVKQIDKYLWQLGKKHFPR